MTQYCMCDLTLEICSLQGTFLCFNLQEQGKGALYLNRKKKFFYTHIFSINWFLDKISTQNFVFLD